MLIIDLLIEKGSENSLRESSGFKNHSQVKGVGFYTKRNGESPPCVLHKYQLHVENYSLVKEE